MLISKQFGTHAVALGGESNVCENWPPYLLLYSSAIKRRIFLLVYSIKN